MRDGGAGPDGSGGVSGADASGDGVARVDASDSGGPVDVSDGAAPVDVSDGGARVDVSDGAAPVDVSDGGAHVDASDGGNNSPVDAVDTSAPVDASNDGTAPADASDASSPNDAGSDGGAAPLSAKILAAQNGLELDGCSVNPALLSSIPPGTYTITLTASTLSKGGVSGTTPPTPSVDNYVVVNLPLPAGDPHEDQRFFMLNGIGAAASVTLPATGTIQLMFIDSDMASNSGEATVTLEPGGYSATVNAVNNVIRWQEGCLSTPSTLVLPGGPQRVTLVDSSLSDGNGSTANYVLVRIPSEMPMDDHRFIILNGVGSFFDFTPFNSSTLRAWFINSSGGSGQATISVSAR